MLNCKMVTPVILEVTETAHSFVDTKLSYWYFNTLTEEQTQTGNKDSYLTEKMIKMTHAGVAWMKKYYLLNVGKGN